MIKMYLLQQKMVTGINRNQKIKTRKIIKNEMKKTNKKKRNSSFKNYLSLFPKIKKISWSSLENKEKNYQDIVARKIIVCLIYLLFLYI